MTSLLYARRYVMRFVQDKRRPRFVYARESLCSAFPLRAPGPVQRSSAGFMTHESARLAFYNIVLGAETRAHFAQLRARGTRGARVPRVRDERGHINRGHSCKTPAR